MKILPFCLVTCGFGRLSVPKKAQFQEYVAAGPQPPLRFSDSDGNAVDMGYKVMSPSGVADPFRLEREIVNGRLVGELYLDQVLDRETTPEYVIQVESYDSSSNIVDSRDVTIVVSDTNDNKPVIDQNTLTMEISEDTVEAGHVVGYVHATDKDEGKFANLAFKKRSSGPDTFFPVTGNDRKYENVFNIETENPCTDPMVPDDKECGKVTFKGNSQYLDSEKYEKVTFEIEVSDDPTNPAAQSHTIGTVTVFITDVNDNAPVFSPEMTLSGEVRESAQPGDKVGITFMATDADKDGINSHIAYEVVDQNVPFSVDGSELIVSGELDFESKDIYHLHVRAFNPNAVGSELDTTTVITVTVLDTNEPPVCRFDQSETPMENAAGETGRVIGRVECTDGDSGNQQMTYSLSDPAGFFEIDQDGSVRVVGELDREWSAKNAMNHGELNDYLNNGQHGVLVTVVDDGIPSMEGNFEVGVVIGDVADEAPMFDGNEEINFCSDPEKMSEVKFPIVALDQNVVIDSVVVRDHEGEFQVTHSEGIFWHLAYTGSQNSLKNYLDQLTLVATDSNGRVSEKTYAVKICDCDSEDLGNAPCFAGVTKVGGGFPWWIIVVIVALLVGIILIGAIAMAKRRQGEKQVDDRMHPDDDNIPFISGDSHGGEALPNFNPGNVAIVNEKPNRTGTRPRPDGDLGDIINQCKDAADNEEIVPNALLSFEFEGRNSIISDLSSLHSFAPEEDLKLDALPDTIQNKFR